MKHYFGPNGKLSQSFADYEVRGPQNEMAEAVFDAINTGQNLIVEAGTGVGKTLAYLIPIFESGKSAVISTATKVLQHQLLEKDIPVIKKVTGLNPDVSILKGRSNYLCLLRKEQFMLNPLFRSKRDIPVWAEVKAWLSFTEAGDFSEMEEVPVNHPILTSLNADRNYCTGSKCPFYRECYFYRARKKAQKSQIVLVNHHLLFADLSVKETNFATILPLHPVLTVDEAHKLEDIATSQFGEMLTARMIAVLLGQLPGELKFRHTEKFRELLEDPVFDSDMKFRQRGVVSEEMKEKLLALKPGLETLRKDLTALDDDTFEMRDNLIRRIGSFFDFLDTLENQDFVKYYDSNSGARQFRSVPIDISSKIEQAFSGNFETIIMTSATLSVRKKLDFFKNRVGLKDAKSCLLASTFDFKNNTILYVPKTLPDVNQDAFRPAAVEEIIRILNLTEGRAFLLCTSHRNVSCFADELRARTELNILKQGESSAPGLVGRFIMEQNSVLVGSFSFWEGIDVKGEALSCVIIDRLPFPQPDEPVFKARADRMENGFFGYSVPLAVLQFKQGLGRLIRSNEDRGILCVLDNRVLTKRYGKIFLESFYPVPLTRSLDEVKKFLAQS
ncbi:MAG: ATP-dependent DNA helicase [Acidobacteria bacterium]|nr:ATP-dependent DNA helicase [Acidobacteriota bacterium]